MKEVYICPTIKEMSIEGERPLMSNSGGGITGEAPDMKGEMNCECDGDPDKCTCGEDCDCWGCRGWEVKGFDF